MENDKNKEKEKQMEGKTYTTKVKIFNRFNQGSGSGKASSKIIFLFWSDSRRSKYSGLVLTLEVKTIIQTIFFFINQKSSYFPHQRKNSAPPRNFENDTPKKCT